jgi:hypothetical protein
MTYENLQGLNKHASAGSLNRYPTLDESRHSGSSRPRVLRMPSGWWAVLFFRPNRIGLDLQIAQSGCCDGSIGMAL